VPTPRRTSTRRRRSRALRGIVLGTTLAVTTALLTGCSTPGAIVLDTEAPVTITMWSGQSDQAEKLLQRLVAEFEEAHPNVTIDMSAGSSSTEELLQKLAASFAGHDSPDVSYTFGSWASQLERSGRTLDLRDVVSDPDVRWDEFSSAARSNTVVL
jgi:multiple sugar transport system substrate-binding protein